jgi:hypothetical protein
MSDDQLVRPLYAGIRAAERFETRKRTMRRA